MSKALILALFVSNLLAASACTPSENKHETTDIVELPGDTVKVRPFLVDVRTTEEFASGSANGAVNIPLDQIESRIAEFQGKDQIVVFCRSGSRSSQAAAILKAHGITNVTNGGTVDDVREQYK